jgi:alkanesulfonate monooxygenase SsuD/methylene tetrahydromethanopterin reductase-like flavin-dependent oxidoreductase (luciferase family)
VDIGIGLPTQVPDVDGQTMLDWAVRADEDGFSTLGTVGRLVYPSYDDLVLLAAAAAVTRRIRLTTSVLLAPLHANVALLAKQTASIDRLSGGRLVVGVGTGGRDDDFTASGLPTTRRGARLGEQVEELKRIWAGEERGMAGAIGPTPAQKGGPPVVIGAFNPGAIRRFARVADGWIMGGGTPDAFAQLSAIVDEAWRDAGRTEKPRKLSLAYFALGTEAVEQTRATIKHYYAWLGEFADQIAAGIAVNPEMVRAYAAAFEQAGCDELIFTPGSDRPDQITLLAEAIAGR